MLLNLRDLDLPSLHGMALFAVGSQLALVNIGMAIGAARAGIGEDHPGVTLGTRHGLVHSAERVLGLVVIEFRLGPDGLPSHGRVAVLAGNVQCAVGAAAIGVGRRLRASNVAQRQQKRERQFEFHRRNQNLPDKNQIRPHTKLGTNFLACSYSRLTANSDGCCR